MPMPTKPDHLRKKPFTVAITPATLAAIDANLEPGQTRSAWIGNAIDKALKAQGIKVKDIVRNN